MGRKYNLTWFSVGGADLTAKDLLQITAAASKVLRIAAIHVEQHTDYGDAQAEGLRLQFIRGTVGGSGTLITTNAAPHSPSDTAFAGVARGGDGTTLLTALTPAAAPFVLVEGGMNIQAGWHWTPPPGYEWEVAPSALVALRVLTAQGDAISFEITVEMEELG